MKADSGALKVPGDLESIAKIRHWLEELLHLWPVPDQIVSDILSAVTEVCSNVVRHGYTDENTGDIELEAVFKLDTVELTITDTAAAFTPDRGSRLPANGLAEGGYGKFLVQSLMDQVRYEPLGETGNRTTLIKRVSVSRDDPQSSKL